MATGFPARCIPSPRIWVFFALLAVIGYVACGSGAVACNVARPIAIGATVLATVISFFDNPRPASDITPD